MREQWGFWQMVRMRQIKACYCLTVLKKTSLITSSWRHPLHVPCCMFTVSNLQDVIRNANTLETRSSTDIWHHKTTWMLSKWKSIVFSMPWWICLTKNGELFTFLWFNCPDQLGNPPGLPMGGWGGKGRREELWLLHIYHCVICSNWHSSPPPTRAPTTKHNLDDYYTMLG